MSKVKPRKISLVDFIIVFGSEDKQIKFFFDIKWPNGFSCDKCNCQEYYIVKRDIVQNGYLIVCKVGGQHCGKRSKGS